MLEDKVWKGVKSLLHNYLVLQKTDRALILFTEDSAPSVALVCAALETESIPYERCLMAPLHDEGIAERLQQHLPDHIPDGSRLLVLTFERDTMSHTSVIASALSRYDREKVLLARAISTSDDLFRTALHASPDRLNAINASLLHRFSKARRLRVTTAGGTDLDIEIDSDQYRWISNRGRAKLGGAMVLPAGEIATFPSAISGTHVADFAFNINAICDRDVRLDRAPITVNIEDGRATDYHTDDASMMDFLKQCFSTHCAYSVGELGFGTNTEIAGPIALNSHVNERRRGIHLGFGQHNQIIEKMGYQCQIHLDLIARGGLVLVDDDPIPIDLENVRPSELPHPDWHEDEDVFSPESYDLDVEDCCGTLSNEGLRLCTLP